ncbi:MAG: phosphohydrolase, partial [Methylococcaceae bacterium]|nr:phosphohydrolase [Methylococcaceae bacterium]
IMKQHTIYGRDILMSAHNIFPGAIDVAYGHHECLDGSGYPRGLKNGEINLYCRIVAVADRYEAITRQSHYKSALSHLDAVHILNSLSNNNKLDKDLCASFVSYLGYYPPGTIVDLSTGEVAIVLKSNSKHRMRPQLLIVRDAEGNPVEHFVDLAVKPLDDKGNPYKIKMVQLPGYRGVDPPQYQSSVIQAYD